MSSRIELEKSYYVDDEKILLENINKNGFEKVEDSVEEDTYFSDKEETFIKDRVCLRTRLTNESNLELTFKAASSEITELFGKREVNLSLNKEDYEDTIFMLVALGFKKYVSFKKHRITYSKVIRGLEHNIMLDEIEGIGKFVELEIIADDSIDKEVLHEELVKFLEEMNVSSFKEKNEPYRDIVKNAESSK